MKTIMIKKAVEGLTTPKTLPQSPARSLRINCQLGMLDKTEPKIFRYYVIMKYHYKVFLRIVKKEYFYHW